MNTTTRLALAVGLPVAFLAAGHSVSAAPSNSPPIELPGPNLGVEIPADFVTLTDDTGTITVAVPSSWTDVFTSPVSGTPSIGASPDWEGYWDTFDVSGVTFEASPFTTDTEAAARDWALDLAPCADERIEPFDDGVFVGTHLVYTGCGETLQGEYHVVAANPVNPLYQEFTARLAVQIGGPDEAPIRDGILATFDLLTGEAAPGSSTPTSSTVTPVDPPAGDSGAMPPPSGDVSADWTQVVDLTETISIAVPNSWAATNVAPDGQNDDGTPQPQIWATTDDNLFFPPEDIDDTFSVPGVIYRAYPLEAVTPELLAQSVWHDRCTAGPLETYDDGAFVGYIQSFNACGGTATRIVQVEANPRFGSFSLELVVQLTGVPDDEATLDGLLSSFNLVSPTAPSIPAGDAAPTSTAAPSDPLAVLREQVQDHWWGVTITDEEGRCVLESGLDVGAEAEFLVTLLNCGVDMVPADVLDIPSG